MVQKIFKLSQTFQIININNFLPEYILFFRHFLNRIINSEPRSNHTKHQHSKIQINLPFWGNQLKSHVIGNDWKDKLQIDACKSTDKV